MTSNLCRQNNQKECAKVFNKKKWREQKYSNKIKVQKWDDIKRRQALRQFSKEFKQSKKLQRPNESYEVKNKVDTVISIQNAQRKHHQLQKEKEEKLKEKKRIQQERENALKLYKEKKAEKFRKLSQKTRKGQPLMKGRIELLLEKIQKEFSPEINQLAK